MTYPLSNRIPDLSDMFFGNEAEADKRHLWNRRYDDILRRTAAVVGDVHDAPGGASVMPEGASFMPGDEPVNMEVLSERTLASGVLLRRIVYVGYEGDPVPAYMLVPTSAAPGKTVASGKRPAVLALHQTVGCGKDEVAGLDGDPELAYGKELAERGFVVLAPDVLSAGERVYPGWKPYQTAPFYERYPAWSMIGKMATDHRYGVTLLRQLDIVDAERIAAIGHSLGGYNAIFLAAFDRRVRAVVSSCGFCTFAGDARPYRWAVRQQSFTHMPQLTDYLMRSAIPFEFNEIMALACPRPLFNWSAQHDDIFPHWEPIGRALDTVYRLYRDMGASDRFTSLLGSGPHSFPRAIRHMAYAWLEQQLSRVDEKTK